MAVKFEFYESPNTIGTRKKRYHARVVNRERISTDHLAQEIHHSSSLTVADIKATIIALSEKLAYHLKDGARVHIEGIGYFHISLTCPETPTPHSTSASCFFRYLSARNVTDLNFTLLARVECGQISEETTGGCEDGTLKVQATFHSGDGRGDRQRTDRILPDTQRADTP